MAIKQFKDYDKTRAYTDSEQLPRGGYVCRIIGAKVIENSYGQSIKVAYDIEEGEHKAYFQRKYDANTNEDRKWPGVYLLNVPADDGSERDGWTKRRFKTFIEALEASNDGYHFDWDETKFKGKLIGFVMNFRQYEIEGRVGFAPNPAMSTSIDAIREGRFKVPKDKLLKSHENDQEGAEPASSGSVTEDIPF